VRVYKTHSEALEEAKNRGVIVRLAAPISSENSAVAKEFAEVVELRKLDKPFGPSFVSVDARQLVIVESKPDDLKTDRGFDVAIWTTHGLIVQAHEELFERMWSTLPVSKTVSPGGSD
jgi:hypothetical protein